MTGVLCGTSSLRATLSGSAQGALRSSLHTIEVAGGTSFAPEVPGVYLIIEGRLRFLHITDDGQTVATGVLGPEEAFIFRRPWLPGSPSGYIEAFEDTALLVVRERDIPEMVAHQPRLAGAVMRALIRQGTDLMEKTCDIVLMEARERVLRTLVRLAERHGEPDPEDEYVRIAIPLKHQDLATLVGVCRETVTTVLADLTRTGAVRTGRATVYVCRARAIDVLEEYQMQREVDTSA
jgi:CRP/FNR family cyclic AMP-dependent transcriptional regulator